MEENGEKKNNRNQKQRRRHAHNTSYTCLIIYCITCRRRYNIDLEDLHFRFGYRDKIGTTTRATLTAILLTIYVQANRRVSSGIEIAVCSVTMAIPRWR